MVGILVMVYYRKQVRSAGTDLPQSVISPIDWDGIDNSHVSNNRVITPAIAEHQFSGDVVIRAASAQAQLEHLMALSASAPQVFPNVAKEKSTATYRANDAHENKGKSRYSNVKAYDDTRVRMTGGDSDYINANHIQYGVAKQRFWYIASQGPKSNTIDDFWCMIWQQRVKLVSMVTSLDEGGYVKCEQYWPSAQGAETLFGDYGVAVDRQRKTEAYTATGLRVRSTATGEVRMVWHLHFTSWPDHGVPQNCDEILGYLGEMRAVRSALGDSNWPVLVHCSAGIGRTGVLMMIEIGLAMLEAGELPDLGTLLEELREQRAGLCQTPEQFQFAYQALIYTIESSAALHRP